MEISVCFGDCGVLCDDEPLGTEMRLLAVFGRRGEHGGKAFGIGTGLSYDPAVGTFLVCGSVFSAAIFDVRYRTVFEFVDMIPQVERTRC